MSLNPVTPSMVQSLKIEAGCLESTPCQHRCTIILSDGREKRLDISGNHIQLLFNTLESQKITSQILKSHFFKYPLPKDSAESILTDLFK